MNWIVWTPSGGGDLRISPPLTDSFGQLDTILYVASTSDDIRPVRTKMEAIKALYDQYQTSAEMSDGDTFTWRGESRPFARAEGVHIVPIR